MKILHLLASNKYSGAENVVCQIIKMFESEVEMVYCSPVGEIENALKEKNVPYLPIASLNKKEVKKVVEEFKPDIIHAHDIRASIIASAFAKQVKVVSHIHGSDKRNMGRITPKSVLYAMVSKRFHKIICVSNSCLNEYYFKNKIKDKSVVLHNIISLDRLYEQEKTDKNTYKYEVCYLGRLSEVKNPIRALEVMKEVILKRPQTKCVVLGDGELKQQCEAFVKDNGLSQNIELLGFVKNPYKILRSSRVLLMSSISEGTPMALVEAFALGVPIVSTKVDGAVEIVKDSRMGSLYDSNEEAAEQVLEIIENDKKQYVEYLTAFSKEYNDMSSYKQKMLEIYEK